MAVVRMILYARSCFYHHGFRKVTGKTAGPDILLSDGGRNQGPPDLDELWRDFNRKLSKLLGANKNNSTQGPGNGRQGGDAGGPDIKGAGIGIGIIGAILALLWLGSGFFIVQEGSQWLLHLVSIATLPKQVFSGAFPILFNHTKPFL